MTELPCASQLLEARLQELRIPVNSYTRHVLGQGVVRVRAHRRNVVTTQLKAKHRAAKRQRKARRHTAPSSSLVEVPSSTARAIRELDKDNVVITLPQSGPLQAKRMAYAAPFFDVIQQARERFPALRTGPPDLWGVVVTSELPEHLSWIDRDSFASTIHSESDFVRDEVSLVIGDQEASSSSARGRRLQLIRQGMIVPSQATEEGIAWHELGHMLTAAGGIRMAQGQATQDAAARELERFGLGFDDIAGLSAYASSCPTEAIAELASMVFTPGYENSLAPELRQRALAMFDSWGGVR